MMAKNLVATPLFPLEDIEQVFSCTLRQLNLEGAIHSVDNILNSVAFAIQEHLYVAAFDAIDKECKIYSFA